MCSFFFTQLNGGTLGAAAAATKTIKDNNSHKQTNKQNALLLARNASRCSKCFLINKVSLLLQVLFLLLLVPVLTEVDSVVVCGVLTSDVGMNQKLTTKSSRAIDFNTIVIKTLKIAFVLRRFLCNYFAMRGQRRLQNNTVNANDIDISIENTNSLAASHFTMALVAIVLLGHSLLNGSTVVSKFNDY